MYLDYLWFPEYQIARNGIVTIPWQRPSALGMLTEDLARAFAVQLAIEEITLLA